MLGTKPTACNSVSFMPNTAVFVLYSNFISQFPFLETTKTVSNFFRVFNPTYLPLYNIFYFNFAKNLNFYNYFIKPIRFVSCSSSTSNILLIIFTIFSTRLSLSFIYCNSAFSNMFIRLAVLSGFCTNT